MSNRSRLTDVVTERHIEHAATFLLGIGSLVMIGFGVLAGSAVTVGNGAMMAGLLVVSRLFTDLHSGVTSSNWGTWRREENRVRFHCNVCFWGVVAMLWFLFGILALFGFIQVTSQ